MPPTAKAKHSGRSPPDAARTDALRSDSLSDDSLQLQGLAPGRVFSLGPIGVDGGEPAMVLFRVVRDAMPKLPFWLARRANWKVVYELGASAGDYVYAAGAWCVAPVGPRFNRPRGWRGHMILMDLINIIGSDDLS
jgi:hypothetical protein